MHTYKYSLSSKLTWWTHKIKKINSWVEFWEVISYGVNIYGQSKKRVEQCIYTSPKVMSFCVIL